MKKYEDMDQVEKQNIQAHIKMVETFLYILSQKNFDDQSLSLLKSNFNNMKYILQDLGIVFPEQDRIRELNESIKRLENSQIDKELSNIKISSYIQKMNNDIVKALESVGVKCNVQVSFTTEITVNILLYTYSKKENSSFYKNQEDKELSIKKNAEKYNLFKENFVVENSMEDLIMVFDNFNIEKITKIVSEVLNIECSYSDFSVETRYIKENNKIKYQTPALKNLNLKFLVSESSKNLLKAFNNYR